MMKPAILIADDEREIPNLIESHLQKEGYLTKKASDGLEQLIKSAQSNNADYPFKC
ncbi:hypothetical protein IPU53_01925 [Bacillus sp. SD088]|nr:hypothetical protein [Bacillus sp. SD088]